MAMKIQLIGSLRNPKVPLLGNRLRAAGFDVFDDWWGAGERADDCWQQYEVTRGRSYVEALYGEAADNIFYWDREHMDAAEIAVLLLPAGKSSHLELGYMIGQGKPGYVVFDREPERFDLMYRFANGVFFHEDDLLNMLAGGDICHT
ncbi:hypothetical protein LCGC14_0581620 [marine sediment metagenome]|uniref:Nucleoside 2-deoxyribosyltransferase n=1 Tax=marine sediment metagenome TaxID=412755 RepID=A0A0F9RZV6_9ZZZZ